jgi:acetylglutamate kinase
LSGADANIIPAKRRSATPIDYGFVGDIDPRDIHSDTIVTLLKSGITPVFCALTHDGQGSMLNSNADSVASALAVALSDHDTAQLVYCFEQRGVLKDLNDPESLISVITPDVYQDLRSQGIVSKGMIPKIDNAFNAIRQGVSSVVIKHSDNLKNNIGTTIKMS